jgi:hypothetical protein
LTYFSKLKSEEVLNEDSIVEYQRLIGLFWNQLVKLNTNIFIIKKIHEFPFDIFCTTPEKMTFFSIVIENLIENSVLTITKLATDQGSDPSTLPRFKNWVLSKINTQYSLEFQNWLKKTRFDIEIKRLLEKAKRIRSSIIAHLNKGLLFRVEDIEQITISELVRLKDKLIVVIDALSFNVGFKMLPLCYAEDIVRPKETEYQSDIDEILDSIAQKSGTLNMPEKYPEAWNYMKKSYSEEAIKILNKYRKKFKLPEV